MYQAESSPGYAISGPGRTPDGMCRSGRREKSRGLECRRAGSWWRSDLTEVPPRRIINLRETFLTVGVREREIGRIHAMCLSIRPRRDPSRTISGRSGLVSNAFADTTDGKYFRCDEHLPHRRGKRFTSCLSDHLFKSHTPPPSFSIYLQRSHSRGLSRYSRSQRPSQRGQVIVETRPHALAEGLVRDVCPPEPQSLNGPGSAPP